MLVIEQLKSQIGKPLSEHPSLLGRWLEGTLIDAELGSLTVEFDIRDNMTNAMKTLHGGATAAIIDDTIGMTAESLGHETHFVTLNLSIDYLSSAKSGQKIVAKTNTVREGRNIINIECVITSSEGKIIAKGTSNLYKTAIMRQH